MTWLRLMALLTDRLELRALTPAALLALRDGDAQFTAVSGLTAADGLRGYLVSDDVSPAWLERLRASRDADPWQHGFGVVERASGLVVGAAGFKGPPDDLGVVEIAYGVVPSREGRGYATEAAGALVQFASADARVRRIIAHTLPERNASTKVLTKCGFQHVGAVEDPEDGLVWRWERDPDAQARANA
jgi:[ribosomal protein S5]-alanine N-acetyltransferase